MDDHLDALLADLQNTVSGGIGSPYGYGSTGSVRSTTRSPDSDGYASRTELYGPKSLQGSYGRSPVPPSSSGRSPSAGFGTHSHPGGHPGETQDQAQYGHGPQGHHIQYGGTDNMNGSAGHYNGSLRDSGAKSPAQYSRPSSAQSTVNRPSVDSLLDELNSGEVIYTGPKKVTITVKETKTETGFPGETELISSHVTTTHTPAASTATRELDDLMASL
nr:unnamed protein product [Callosobruchus chinensis]